MKFCKDCYYKYKGGLDNNNLIENVVYKCIYCDNNNATLEFIKVTNHCIETIIVPLLQTNFSHFTKSGVQEKNWINNNTKIINKNMNHVLTPFSSTKKPFVAKPEVASEEFKKEFYNYTPVIEATPIKIDNINPEHYKQGGIEPIEYIYKNKLSFMEGNVVKYITRHQYKNGAEDVKKAIQYCKFILKYKYGIKD